MDIKSGYNEAHSEEIKFLIFATIHAYFLSFRLNNNTQL